MRVPDLWSRQDLAARLAVAVLSPLGWIYGAVTALKRINASPRRARARVVCVGNLTAGGSGKTPVVHALASMLKEKGLLVVILSRGYGGRLREATFVVPGRHGANDVGDEPLMLAAIAPVIVSRDRRAGAALADSHGADVIVMDDGHQNFQLEKDLSIVVVDAETGFGNGHILPAGPLRETVRAGLARADVVVLVGAGAPALPGYSGPVLRVQLKPHDELDLQGEKVVAFAGIGRPDKLFSTLHALGADVADTVAFPDHHVFTASEIARLKSKARNAGAMLITTEKDFVRLTPAEREGIIPLRVRAQFESADAAEFFLERIALHGRDAAA
jgi:tetraacyldisaccharide 4'-kinase